MKNLILLLLLFFSAATFAQSKSTTPDRQKIASIGDLKLESGSVINDCQIGYRTYGHLNSAKSNGILLTTWFGGTAKVMETTNPWQVIDTTRYCLIIVDALGNGVSSSPSNSIKQHGPHFPVFSIRDMVESQHELLTKKLGILQVHAIIGISMGGIQAFQWAVSYPDFTKKIIPIVGSPRPTSYDLMQYYTYRTIIENDSAFNHGNYTVNPNIVAANLLMNTALTTPADKVKNISYSDFPKWMENMKTQNYNDWNDNRYQIIAVMGNDVSRPYNGSLSKAAAHIKAKMLIISSKQDHTVNPSSAIEFSKLLPTAKLIVLDNDLGHLAGNFDEPAAKKDIIAMLVGN